MPHTMNLPQNFKIVDATAGPVTTNGGVTSDAVSLKNAIKAWIVLQFTQAVGHATAITPRQATDVAVGTNKVLTNNAKIWANEDTAASDTLAAATDAKNYSLTNDIKKKLVVIEIDPTSLDISGGYDCLYFTVGDSSQATNFVSASFILLQRYQQAAPAAAITD